MMRSERSVMRSLLSCWTVFETVRSLASVMLSVMDSSMADIVLVGVEWLFDT